MAAMQTAARRSNFPVNIIYGICSNLPSQTIRQNKKASGPGVYVAWENEQALYIGSSVRVLHRIGLTRRHETDRHRALFLEATHLDIFPCDSIQQARHLEVQLIDLYKPAYNKIGHLRASRSIQQLQADHAKLFLNSKAGNQDSVLEVCS